MPRCVVIDPSIKDFQGHYFEYALRVARAAAAEGYEPVIAANRSFCAGATTDARIVPVYKYGYFRPVGRGYLKSAKVVARRGIDKAKVWAIRLAYSRLALLLCRSGAGTKRERSASRFRRAVRRVVVGPFWLIKRGLRRDALVARLAGWTAKNGKRLAARARAVGDRLARRVVNRGWSWVKERRFARDTAELFERAWLQDGDVVLLSAVSIAELKSLAWFFARSPESQRASWHLMFRRDVPTAPKEREQFVAALSGLAKWGESRRIFFYTDTDELTADYERLGIGEFQTLPIPVDQRYYTERRCQRTGPRVASYVGDARGEKGYQHLPRLVSETYSSGLGAGDVQFVIQSNIADGASTPEIRTARNLLKGASANQARLVASSLDSEQYRQSVVDADVMLVPYDRKSYQARSSGILVEALSAAIPVIVPAGTWMAGQLAGAIRDRHDRLCRESLVGSCLLGTRAWRPRANDSARGERLATIDGRARWTVLDGFPRSSHLRVLVSLLPGAGRQAIEARADQFDELGRFLATSKSTVSPHSDQASALLPLDGQTHRIELQLRLAFAQAQLPVRSASAYFLDCPAATASSAVGVVYDGPEELPAALEEIVRHYDHYHATAEAQARAWSDYHNERTLFNQLVQNSKSHETAGRKPSGPAAPEPARTAYAECV